MMKRHVIKDDNRNMKYDNSSIKHDSRNMNEDSRNMNKNNRIKTMISVILSVLMICGSL